MLFSRIFSDVANLKSSTAPLISVLLHWIETQTFTSSILTESAREPIHVDVLKLTALVKPSWSDPTSSFALLMKRQPTKTLLLSVIGSRGMFSLNANTCGYLPEPP